MQCRRDMNPVGPTEATWSDTSGGAKGRRWVGVFAASGGQKAKSGIMSSWVEQRGRGGGGRVVQGSICGEIKKYNLTKFYNR